MSLLVDCTTLEVDDVELLESEWVLWVIDVPDYLEHLERVDRVLYCGVSLELLTLELG